MLSTRPVDVSSFAHVPRRDPVWPLPALNGRMPTAMNTPSQGLPGLELAYPRARESELVAEFPPSSPNGSQTHFMPNLIPVFAAFDGVITFAGRAGRAFALIIDHGNGWATHCSSLEHIFTPETSKESRHAAMVRAGDVLGYVGASQPGSMKCLQFELWRRNDEGLYEAVDPTTYMHTWQVLPWSDDSPASAASLDLARAA